MTLAPGQTMGGKYRLIEPLASGGMGALWRARHEHLEIDVAVKVMSKDLAGSPVAVERFKREARAAAVLKSPNVVRIHDYGLEAGQPYIAMELLGGEDLRARMRRVGPMSLARMLELVAPICKALRLAHEAGIVHRDIKPANVFITGIGEEEVVKVLDFGIAKEVGQILARVETSSNTVLGSPLYMSPEQARKGRVDHRTDLWSVAVIVFELLTGRHPFQGASLGDVFARICNDELPLPSRHGIDHPGLDAWFGRALARDPDRRFGSAKDLADTLSAVALGVPEAARFATPQALPLGEQRPPRRGRDSDTLAIVATSPGDSTAPTSREASTGRRWPLILTVAAGVAALVAYAWTRSPPGEAAPASEPAATSPSSEERAPAPPVAAPEMPAAPPSAAQPTASVSAPHPAPPVGASPSPAQAPPRPLARPLPPPADAKTSSPTPPPPAATSLDPVFGVPVTRP